MKGEVQNKKVLVRGKEVFIGVFTKRLGMSQLEQREEVFYPGYRERAKKMMPPFLVSKNHPLVLKAERALKGLEESLIIFSGTSIQTGGVHSHQI